MKETFKLKKCTGFTLLFVTAISILSLSAFDDKFDLSSNKIPIGLKLDQRDLFKQFSGVWTCKKGKDTTYTFESKIFADSIKTYIKYEANGKIFLEQRGYFGYDKKNEKMVGFMTGSSTRIGMYFSSESICETGPIIENSEPMKVMAFRKCEFKSPNVFVISLLVKDKYTNELVYNRNK